jgi:anaerobic selenocysteine-containing dehydrogenase
LLMHPDDMAARGLLDGSQVCVESRVGKLHIDVMASADMMPGSVSIPHGFGHARQGVKLAIAREHAGVSANDLTDELEIDQVSGNSVLNGTSVVVRKQSVTSTGDGD